MMSSGETKSVLTFHELSAVFFRNGNEAVQFSINNGLLPSDKGLKCFHCLSENTVNWVGKEFPSDFKLICSKCRVTSSVLRKTIFDGARLSIKQYCLCLYSWLMNIPFRGAAVESKISSHLASKLYQIFQEVCYINLSCQPLEKCRIGGRSCSVHLGGFVLNRFIPHKSDESLWRNGESTFKDSVILGFDPKTNQSFVVSVPLLDTDAYSVVIKKYVVPGSEIIFYGTKKLGLRFINYEIIITDEKISTKIISPKLRKSCKDSSVFKSGLELIEELYFLSKGLNEAAPAEKIYPFLHDFSLVFPGYGKQPLLPTTI